MPPPNRRCRQLVVSGGYAAYDSSLPAKTTAATPDKMIVAAHPVRPNSRIGSARLIRVSRHPTFATVQIRGTGTVPKADFETPDEFYWKANASRMLPE